MDDTAPDFVVVGESTSYNFEKITKATQLVKNGAKLIGTNQDVNGPSDRGLLPACGAFASAIEMAAGKKAFFCGKPSSLMMRYALAYVQTSPEDTCMIGDRMDTDVLGGILAQIDPVLVLSGVTRLEEVGDFSYSPFLVLPGVGDIVPEDL